MTQNRKGLGWFNVEKKFCLFIQCMMNMSHIRLALIKWNAPKACLKFSFICTLHIKSFAQTPAVHMRTEKSWINDEAKIQSTHQGNAGLAPTQSIWSMIHKEPAIPQLYSPHETPERSWPHISHGFHINMGARKATTMAGILKAKFANCFTQQDVEEYRVTLLLKMEHKLLGHESGIYTVYMWAWKESNERKQFWVFLEFLSVWEFETSFPWNAESWQSLFHNLCSSHK